jgi:hypothetical protein
MSIIKLNEPWCFNTEELTKEEVEELQNYFVKALVNYNYGWTNANEEQIYVGITSNGLSDYFYCVSSFDKEDENADNVTVYTIEQLRAIIAEHLAKQPVEKLEDGVVYYATDSRDGHEWILVNNVSYVHLTKSRYGTHGTSFDENKEYTYTKATPAQIAHYEACVKAGKYVEPESVSKFKKWRVDNYIVVTKKDSGMLLSEAEEFAKTVKEPAKSERYLATMKFFEQLREPERSEAIVNYDEGYDSDVPESLSDALIIGFRWGDSNQTYSYWERIKNSVDDGTYFKEELLVFGKYKVGDIVVSLKHAGVYRQVGELFTVLPNSKSNSLKYELTTSSQEADTWRPATPEEAEAYNQGVRNIADIKPKQDKRAVKFNSEEERRHILAHFNPAHISLHGIEKGFMCLERGSWSTEWKGFSKDNYTEISFQDWCKEFNHPFDYKEAVHCTTQEEWDFVLSKFNPRGVDNDCYEADYSDCIEVVNSNTSYLGCCSSVDYLTKSGRTILTFKQWCDKYGHSYEEFTKQQEKLKMAELLSEAKRRYPAGTKIRAVVNEPKLTTDTYTLTDTHYWASGSQAPTCKDNKGQPVCLYFLGMWAEIIKEEPWVAKVGDWVYVVDKGSAYKLKSSHIGKCVEIDTYGEQYAIDSKEAGYWLYKKEYRKATQAEIDSVTKTTVTNTQAEWTPDNWYVEVTSQEEANEVIKVAAKMYDRGQDKSYHFNEAYCKVGADSWGDCCLIGDIESEGKKPRPISDFIPVKQEPLWKTEAELIKAAAQQGKLSLSAVYESYRTEYPLIPKECWKTQQDELVIYKPKQTRLVEPGAVSASASTTNLIIKSNSKYL